VAAQPTPDGMIIEGRGDEAAPFAGGTVDSHGDHRIAMAFSVAALRARGEVLIRDTVNVATSFPGFPALARAAGMGVEEAGA
jgi:3-phosphoshikimate 1-carboxyvinyltransferase